MIGLLDAAVGCWLQQTNVATKLVVAITAAAVNLSD